MVLIDNFTNYVYHNTETPSALWRGGSYAVLLSIHALCRTALMGLNNTHVHGLDPFMDILRSRADPKTRTRGLITVSNHISVLDDPVIWGVLPLSFAARHGHTSHRWSFASHDLCMTNTVLAHFFSLGQVLGTHRLRHSKYGGLFQPTFTEGVRLLSRINADNVAYNPHCATVQGYKGALSPPGTPGVSPSWPKNAIDPFSPLTQTGNPAPSYPSYPHDVRLYNAPSRYTSNSYSWIHIFPEGFIHQTHTSERYMRYFKWGVSRLILEPPDPPDLVPMFIEGTDLMMHESRTFPRFIPRLGKKVHVSFAAKVDVEERFGDLRGRWRGICDRENGKLLDERRQAAMRDEWLAYVKRVYGWNVSTEQARWEFRGWMLDELYKVQLGVVSEKLKFDPEVAEIRKECTRRVRDEVLKVRRGRGYADEDPKGGLVETWKLEGPKREGRMDDESWVKET